MSDLKRLLEAVEKSHYAWKQKAPGEWVNATNALYALAQEIQRKG